jgi:hypothetical protein
MGNDGISLPSAPTARIERMVLEENCGSALVLGNAALVSQVQARANYGIGIKTSFGSIVRDSVAEWNQHHGIEVLANSVAANNVVGSNGGSGISLDSGGPHGGLVIGNAAAANGWKALGAGLYPGIHVKVGGAALLNSVWGNLPGPGILLEASTSVGLNTANGNGGDQIQNGTPIACNMSEVNVLCPP